MKRIRKPLPAGYKCWVNMKQRCTNPNDRSYPNYGGRGIKVCAAWGDSFQQFYTDMGARPTGYSIDRIDNDGDYEPSNCKWSTHKEQQSNKRSNRWITYGGNTMTVTQWSKLTGTDVAQRIHNGWDEAKAVSTPVIVHANSITSAGCTRSIMQWQQELCNPQIGNRIRNGWTVDRALTQPYKPNRRTNHAT